MLPGINKIPLRVNPAQWQFVMLRSKNKYAIFSRGTGKSWIVGYEVDENVRLMPRGVTTVTQSTIGQALTKTLPSTFNFLDRLGYKPYDYNTKTGDYVVCKTPPPGWYRPYEHIMQYDNVISFSNGHILYILTQAGNSRGPNADFNITDEALTIDKVKFDQEAAPTNRGNEHVFGRRSAHPVFKHHGNLFTSSMPYTLEQQWLLEPADYYERERGINLFAKWNKLVDTQMQLIGAKLQNDVHLFRELWNECQRQRREIVPFVAKDGTLFILGSVFDNIENLGMSYIINQYKVMDKLSFMVEILNKRISTVDNAYYRLEDRHFYYNAYNDSYLRDVGENSNYDWEALRNATDSRADLDCDPSRALELSADWGSSASFLLVHQERNFDFSTKLATKKPVHNIINEFFVRRNDDRDETEVNVLATRFCNYYQYHANKTVTYYRDRYGDIHQAGSKKSYNELFIEQLQKRGWTVNQRTHAGIEPPQHDKFLLWTYILAETDERFPVVRINATRCRKLVISMRNTAVMEDSKGKFTKDKRSERRKSVAPEEATHFGDTADKCIWTKYGERLKLITSSTFVSPRF